MWSYLTFKFLNPLLNTGYLSPLQEEDLYDLPKQNSPAHNSKILEKAWALEPPPDDQGEGGAFLWRVVMRMIWKPFTMCAIPQLRALWCKGDLVAASCVGAVQYLGHDHALA